MKKNEKNKPGQGRRAKFTEGTKVVSTRVPVSKVSEFNKMSQTWLKQFEKASEWIIIQNGYFLGFFLEPTNIEQAWTFESKFAAQETARTNKLKNYLIKAV